MELTPSQKKTVRHQFDSFCRKVLREEARDYLRELARRAAHEVPFSELSGEQMERLYVLDKYPSGAIHFNVQGYDVAINNEQLADALAALPDEMFWCVQNADMQSSATHLRQIRSKRENLDRGTDVEAKAVIV